MRTCCWILTAVLAVAACSSSSDDGGPTEPGANEVVLTPTSFSPSVLTIAVGERVTWRNQTNTPHTITPSSPAQAGVWSNTSLSSAGATFAHTFSTAGSFNYSCTIHAGMTGRIVVQ